MPGGFGCYRHEWVKISVPMTDHRDWPTKAFMGKSSIDGLKKHKLQSDL